MGDTLNKLIKFISEDPIMLGLCFAIIVLIIIFILVLIFGGKKEKKIEKTDNDLIDNTQALLKTTIEDEPLRSTQEFNLNMTMNSDSETKFDNTRSLKNIQILDEKTNEEEVPITVNEAIELKNQRDMEALKSTMEIPTLSENEMQVNMPTDYVTTPEPITELNQSSSQPLSPVFTTPDIVQEVQPVAPVTDEDTHSLDDVDIALPKLKSEPKSSIFDTLSGESFNINNHE